MKKVSVWLYAEQYNRLKEIANYGISTTIREAIQQYLDTHPPTGNTD